MKLWTRTILAVGLVTTMAFAGDEPAGTMTDPVEILKKADEATKAVTAVCHSTTFVPSGAAAGRQPEVKGKGCYSGIGGQLPKLFRFEFETKGSSDEAAKSFVMGSDGDEFYLIDHQEKKAYVDLDPTVVGRMGQVGRGIGMLEFVHPTPFSDEINGKAHKLEGIEKIGGEPCYKVSLQYANVPQSAVWYFSINDLLPRRADRMFQGPEGQTGGTEQTILNLKVEKSLDEAQFKLKLPEGYEKTDDFAP